MKVKKPNAFLYFLAYLLIYPVMKIFFKLKADRTGLIFPKGPYIVLSNHIGMYDFIIVMLSLFPRLLNAVTAQKFFLYKPLHKLLPLMGCIPKNMFDPDVRSIVGIKTVLKRGDAILMFPEGRCSCTGVYAGIHTSTGKLIKKLGVPVISTHIEGADICMALWRRGMRFGRTRVTCRNLFSEDDLVYMSAEQINKAISARLSGSEGAIAIVKPFESFWSRRLAEGLHQLLYYCPVCKQEFTTMSEKNTIHCSNCKTAASMDKQGRLLKRQGDGSSVFPNTVSLWFKEQVRFEMQKFHADMLPIVENVKVRMPAPKLGDGMAECGAGTISIDAMGWHFDGVLNSNPATLFFPVDAVPAISYDYGSNFHLYHDGCYYMFIPEDLRKCMKYVIYAECLHWKFASNKLLTPGVDCGFLDD